MPSTIVSRQSKWQLRAEAELQLRARRGDPEVMPYIQGFTSYQDDPVGFCSTQLKAEFTEPIKRVVESVRDNPVTIAISANDVGKSFAAARIAVWFYKAYPDAQVYTTATPEKNLMKILWGEIGAVVQQLPHVFLEDKINNDMNIQRGPQSYITGVAIPSSGTPEQREAKFSGRHAPHILFIVDEADAVPPEVFKGIESCMSGGMARLLVMFNPRADIGAVAGMVKRREGNVIHLSAFDHPNVITGEEGIVGAVSREKTVRRINMWSRPLAPGEKPDIECFEVPKFLVGTVARSLANVEYKPLPPGWRKVENPEFFYMVLGIYPPKAESQLISRVWIDAAVSRWLSYVATYGETPPKNMRPLVGLDVADLGRDTNQLTLRYGGWTARQEGWSGVDPDASGIKAHGILKQLGLPVQDLNIFVDATGVGAGVAPRMKRLGASKAEGVMVASSPTYKTELGEFFQLRDQLYWSVMVWLRDDPGAMLPPDDELCDELAAPSYGIKHGKIRITDGDTLRELIGHSPDKASSLALTFAPMPQTVGAWR